MTLVPNTFGWDTVFGVRVSRLNEEIARRGASPTTFSQTIDDSQSIDGTFGPWQITSGTGDIVHLGIPVTSCSVTIDGVTTQITVPVSMDVGVRLEFVPLDTSTAAAEGSPLPPGKSNLVVAKPAAGGANPQWEDSVGFTGDSSLKFDIKLALQTGLRDWLLANLTAFSHVFATIDIDRTADVGAFQWLQPHDGGYAYAADPGGDIFGILATTGDRQGTDLPRELSSGLLADGIDAGLLIAPARLLDELVITCLVSAFPGTAPTDYALAADDSALTLVAPVQLAHAKSPDGQYAWDPYLDKLDVRIQGSTLVIDAATHATIMPGIHSFGRHRVGYIATLVTDDKGQRIAFQPDPSVEPISVHWPQTDPGYTYADYVVEAVGAIALIVLSFLTDGVPLLLIGIGIALAEGAVMVVPKIAALSGEDEAPSIDLMVTDATGSVAWSDSGDFDLSAAALAGGLLLSGSLPQPTT
jgi:hypothetical protein